MDTQELHGEQLIDVRGLTKKLHRCRASIHSDVKAGRMPAPLKITPRCVRWKISDIEAWLDGLQGAA